MRRQGARRRRIGRRYGDDEQRGRRAPQPVERRSSLSTGCWADGEDEVALARRARAGDRRAFDALVGRYGHAVLAYLRRLIPEEAEDVFQETFVRAWKGLPHLEEPRRLRAWLLTIATHAARRRYARRVREGADALALDECGDAPDARIEAPIARIERRERADAVRAAIEHLPPRQRAVLALRIDLDLSFKELGAVLGIREENARAHHHHALKALERVLRPLLGPDAALHDAEHREDER